MGLERNGVCKRNQWWEEERAPAGAREKEGSQENGQEITIPFRPESSKPTRCRVMRFEIKGVTITAVARLWPEHDTVRCGLYPGCKCSTGSICLVGVEKDLSDREAALLKLDPHHVEPG